jgi:cardiolipin synthase
MTAWLLLFLLMPPVGAAIYLVFGARKLRRQAERKPGPAEHDVQLKDQQRTPINDLDHLIQSYRLPPATDGNLVTLCGTAVTAYEAVLDLIDRAEASLWVTTYVLGDDPVGHEVVRRLTEKAGAGVQVRLLIDDVGSKKLPDSVLARLISAGGRAARFMPASLVPRSRHYANLRSHRKIIIVDRREVWSGGMNLSEQYLGPAPVENGFRDLSFVVKGPAAEVYGEVFAVDWLFTTGEDLRAKRPWTVPAARAAGPGVVQVVPSGPEFPLPSVVQPRKEGSGIPGMPAGTEIRVRTAGTRRPKKIALRPWRSNQALARSTSSGWTVSHRPCRAARRFRRSVPSQRPA